MLGVLRHLFSEAHPLQEASAEFARMLLLASNMVRRASNVYWGSYLSPREELAFHASDADVDRLQREVRKRLLAHFSSSQFRTSASEDAAHALMLMSLVKDVERLGDYAKNLLEVHGMSGRGAGDMPDGPLGDRLRQTGDFVEQMFGEIGEVFSTQRKDRALELVLKSGEVRRACDELVFDAARELSDVGVAVDVTLAARYYKRIVGHGSNLVSSLLVPVHRLDQFWNTAETLTPPANEAKPIEPSSERNGAFSQVTNSVRETPAR